MSVATDGVKRLFEGTLGTARSSEDPTERRNTVSRSELEEIVKEWVAEALAEQRESPPSATDGRTSQDESSPRLLPLGLVVAVLAALAFVRYRRQG